MKIRLLLVVVASCLLLVPAGSASAVALHSPHQGTSVECDDGVLWHFVHNQVGAGDTTTGELTATFAEAGVVQVSAYKVLRSVRHYEVITSSSDTLVTASDSISGGKLVLSNTDCVPGEPSQECASGDTTTVTWGDVELGRPDVGSLVESASTAVALLPGSYSVALTSGDPVHAAGFQTNQDQEQWYVVLELGGAMVGSTGVTGDLPDASTTATYSGGTIDLVDGADTAVATHALIGQSNWGSPESVVPTTAVFTCL